MLPARAPLPPAVAALKRLFGNVGVLITAWFLVAALLASLAAVVFLQPPPPPAAEPVTVALDPSPAEGGPEGEPEAATPPPAQPETEPAPPVEPPAPPEAPPQQAPAQEPQSPAPEAQQPEAQEPEAQQPPAQQPAAEPPVTPPEPPVQPPQASSQEPAHAPQAPEPGAAAPPPADGGATQQEALATIPGIPPAPEQLPYWERYRQPFNMDDKRPRIAVVMTGLGLSDSATEAAIDRLPAAVTLSFSPYARDLERWMALARSRGHEVMLDLPMEPATFPNEDPGPQALLTGLSPQENLDRLDWVLARGSAYVGVAGAMGSRFTATREAIEPVLRELHDRGLLMVDRHASEESLVPGLAGEIGLPHAVNSRSVDERQASRIAIDARLAQVERIALTEGVAVAMAQPYPVTLDRLADWAAELTARGFAIAPVSAVIGLQKAP